MADTLSLLADLAVAFGLGLLIGLQREQSGQGLLAAGSRTFPLVALSGALTQAFLPGLAIAALAGITLLVALGYMMRVRDAGDPGLATPVAAILTFLYGTLAMTGDQGQLVAIVLAVATTVILALKKPLHGFAKRLSPEEVRAMLTFLVVALVVLPLLPDRSIGWLLGLNPRFVWMMVVFVSAIDLAAFLFVRAFATQRGHLLAGVVGGLVSSTAATVSLARRTRAQPHMVHLFRIGIVVASVVMLIRMMVEVAVVDRSLLPRVVVPLALVAAWCAAVVGVWLRRPMPSGEEGNGPRNPFRLMPALAFGLAFAAILVVTSRLGEAYGHAGVYGAAVLSGLVDVDAITMSLARLAATGELDRGVAASAIVVVAASNLSFKVALVAALGTRRLTAAAALAFAAAPAIAVAFLLAN